MIRKKCLYDPLNINIINWDYPLDFLKTEMVPLQQPVEAVEIHSGLFAPKNILLLIHLICS